MTHDPLSPICQFLEMSFYRVLRSFHKNVGNNVHSNGLMRSPKSIRNDGIMRSLRSFPPLEDAHQDNQQAASIVDEEQVDIFKKPLGSMSMILSHLYDRLTQTEQIESPQIHIPNGVDVVKLCFNSKHLYMDICRMRI